MDDVTVTCQITRRVTQCCGTQLIVFCGYYYVSVHIIELAAPHREAPAVGAKISGSEVGVNP